MAYPSAREASNTSSLSEKETIALVYHDIFGYPLSPRELSRWEAGERLRLRRGRPRAHMSGKYFTLLGRENLVAKRLKREAFSKQKMSILARAKKIFEDEESVRFVGITGSLAMSSASAHSDIDLMVITKKGQLWATRLKILLKLARAGIAVRRRGDNNEADKLCLNMWLDESKLQISDPQNAYTAHEIVQIVPVINKGGTHEKFMAANRWILGYWPKAVEIKYVASSVSHIGQKKSQYAIYGVLYTVVEKVAYFLQKGYMARKRTREVVTPTRSFFHPNDWSSKVVSELERRGVVHV